MSDVAESNVQEAETAPVAEAPKPAPVKKVAPKKVESPQPETKAAQKKKAAKAPESKSAKKKVAKKAAPKKVAKKAAKAAPKKAKAAKKVAGTGAGRPKKDGLRKPQVRILAALNKATRGLTRAEIAAKAEVDLATMTSYIGSDDETIRARLDKIKFPSLLTLKYMKPAAAEKEDTRAGYYTITASGKAALEKATK
jgi:outer membrane biosynthesis protein TonB